jgi:hypothetical protein
VDTTGRPEQRSATAAGIYDYYIGGTHNVPADRAAAEAAIRQVPLVRPAARANRAFLGRAVRFAAESGIRQFLDIGSGIPTEGNVHEIAQRVDPAARVVYVDIDPVAVAEGREILAGNRHATAIRGNVLDTAAILADPGVAGLLDLSRPVAVILCAMLHFVTDDEAAGVAVGRLRSASGPGSCLILSHGTRPDADVAAEERARFAADDEAMRGVYASRTTTPVRLRPRADVEAFFGGYELVEPGLTWVGGWRPDAGAPDEFGDDPRLSSILGGVAVRR